MNSLDAAYKILAEASQPLHSTEIARRMLDQGLWKSAGKTPGATVDARIAVDIKTNGAASRFQRVGRSIFTINDNGAPPAASPVDLQGAANLSARASDAVPSTPASQPLSFVDAAERVLDQFAHQQPMHYQEVTRRALDLGLIATAGQTPAATMYAVILTEIDRMVKRGEQPRFTKHGKGLVGLANWTAHDQGLTVLIEQHNRATRTQLHARLHTMQPAEFEALIGRLLTAIGFEAVAV